MVDEFSKKMIYSVVTEDEILDGNVSCKALALDNRPPPRNRQLTLSNVLAKISRKSMTVDITMNTPMLST